MLMLIGEGVLVSYVLYNKFCLFLGNSLVFWRSKKQATVSRSSSEVGYKGVASVTCEILWVINCLRDLKIKCKFPIEIMCDNKSSIQLNLNLVFHARTKHIKMDVYLVREKVLDGIVKNKKVDSKIQIIDVFTKSLGGLQHSYFCNNLLLFDPF